MVHRWLKTKRAGETRQRVMESSENPILKRNLSYFVKFRNSPGGPWPLVMVGVGVKAPSFHPRPGSIRPLRVVGDSMHSRERALGPNIDKIPTRLPGTAIDATTPPSVKLDGRKMAGWGVR
ncbi:unnamed protein product [Fusarium venenatum]|uniref:Uncharacterized protein n=1 Tax=Fusarium venenatum TaxID=56646 RepID=A0A2L2SZF9_9HYPO|nr:uncharacterized protein FVRRES_11664 [Fusarium venenatum]CEI38973.1 unnamed protein product [Fusarium venenatum]